MLKLITTNQFEKDLRRMVRRGKDQSKLFQIMQELLDEKRLDPSHRDHKLKGPLAGRRECHIQYDWLLIYIKRSDSIIFERTGTHSDLFK